MKIHEFQAKDLFSEYGVSVPGGRVAENPEQVAHAAEKMGLPVVVKAQIHAGGRGKAGGIKICPTLKDARQAGADILGKKLVTHQTGPEGRIVRRVLVEKPVEVESEFYVAATLDRRSKRPVLMVSPEGGMDIEEVAAKKPDKILTERVNPLLGLQQYQIRRLVAFLGVSGLPAKKMGQTLAALFKLYMEKDASLVEVNPLVVTKAGDVVALDGKVVLDDNALSRHPNLAAMRDVNEENPLDVEASKHDLNYIKLDGNIGCMVNGAGLAMATMDIIKLHGGEPANFLDVGGGASAEQIEHAFRLLLADPNTEGILINIFGGILRCDVLAQGLVEGASKAEVKAPMVIRLEGTNAEEGRKILAKSGLPFTVAATLEEAAQKIIHLARERGASGSAKAKSAAAGGAHA